MDKYNIVHLALKEDIGTSDVSAALLPHKPANAQVISREKAVICGLDYFEQAFLQMDDKTQIHWLINPGDEVSPNEVLCHIKGSTRTIISAERVGLNFLQTLSGTATQTRQLVAKIKHSHTQILDTRKTLPNLRLAQKEAVRCGGGVNHRLGLYDAVMLKENHLMALGGTNLAIAKAKEQYPHLPLIIEVENLHQLNVVLAGKIAVDRILCDNFSPAELKQAVLATQKKVALEASGNINEENIVDYANTGVDYISIGAITKNVKSVDLSLRFLGTKF